MYATLLLLALHAAPPQAPLPRQAPMPPQAPALKHCGCAGGPCECGANCHCLAAYEWRRYSDTTDQLALYKGGTQIGAWNYVFGYYRPVNAQTKEWGAKCKPPCDVPPRPEKLSAPPRGLEVPLPTGSFFQPGADCANGTCSSSPGAGRRR